MMKPAPAVIGPSPRTGRRAPARRMMLYPSSQLYPSSAPPAGETKPSRSQETAVVAKRSNGPTRSPRPAPNVAESGSPDDGLLGSVGTPPPGVGLFSSSSNFGPMFCTASPNE